MENIKTMPIFSTDLNVMNFKFLKYFALWFVTIGIVSCGVNAWNTAAGDDLSARDFLGVATSRSLAYSIGTNGQQSSYFSYQISSSGH
jgi:hypothetical protein